MEIKKYKTNNESGFALLLTLIVVGVVISIGLSMLDLSLKQIRLSTNSKESETAFHAANAGMECAKYWRRAASTSMELGQAITPDCFGGTLNSNTVSQLTVADVTGNGEVFQYQYEFTWGVDASCTQINTLVASSTILGLGVTTTNMTTHIPGFPDGNDKYCEAGARCTVVSVRGYNRPCNTATGFGTVQREVLLQY